MSNDLAKIFSGSIVVFLSKIINAGAQYLLILILGRFLGPAEVGLFFLGRAIMKFLNIVGTLGFQGSLLKFIPEHLAKKQYGNIYKIINFALISSFAITLLIAIILYTNSNFISIHLFKDKNLIGVMKLFAIGLPLFGIMTIILSLIQSFRDMIGFSTVENIILPGGTIVITYLFFAYHRDIRLAVIAYLISISIAIGIGCYCLFKNMPKNKEFTQQPVSQKEILSFSIPFMGTGILGFALMWMDTFMLGIMTTTEAVGIYNGAARIAFFSNIVLVSVNTVFAPTISKLYTNNDLIGIESAYKNSVRWIIHLSLPFFLCIIIFSKEIMGLYGNQFAKGSTVLIILSIGQIVSMSVGSAGYLLTMTGRPKTELLNRSISLILNFFLNLLLIPVMGPKGAAIATASSLTMVNMLRFFENYINLNIHPFSLGIIFPFMRK